MESNTGSFGPETARRGPPEAPPAAHTGWVAHRHHRLYYESYGEGDRVLVYMHGLLLDSGMNRPMARILARSGFRVVLLDLLGHGRSDRPAHASEYRMDLYARQVVALLNELGIEQAAIGGVSLGANVSLMVGALAPDRVRGMVLEMPVLEWAVPAAALLFAPLVLVLHYAAGPVRIVGAVAGRLPRTRSDVLNSVLDSASIRPESAAAVLHGILVGPVAPTAEHRAAITAPTLVLGHPADLIHPLSDATNLVRQMPDATLLRASSLVELRFRPERLTGEIARFLAPLWEGPGRASSAA